MRLDWIQPGRLAAGARPGLLEPIEADYAQLRGAGIHLIVNLTAHPLDPDPSDFGMRTIQEQILDMGIPTPRRAHEVVTQIRQALDADQGVLVHCRAGLGRTGTVLACYLVSEGQEAQQAVADLRLINNRFVQNQLQERFVQHYGEWLADTVEA